MEFKNVIKYAAGLALLGTAVGFGLLFKEVRKEPTVESARIKYEEKAKKQEDLATHLEGEIAKTVAARSNVQVAKERLTQTLTAKNEAYWSNVFEQKFNVASNQFEVKYAELGSNFIFRINEASNQFLLTENKLNNRIMQLEDNLFPSYTFFTEIPTNSITLTPLERELYVANNLPQEIRDQLGDPNKTFYEGFIGGRVRVTAKNFDDIKQVSKRTKGGYILLTSRDNTDNGVISASAYSTTYGPDASVPISVKIKSAVPERTVFFPGGNLVNVARHSDGVLLSIASGATIYKADNERAKEIYSTAASNRLVQFDLILRRGPQLNTTSTNN